VPQTKYLPYKSAASNILLTRLEELEEVATRLELRRRRIISWRNLREILSRGENEKVEWKRLDILQNPFHLAKSMAAIANTEGGMLLIGVADNGQIEGIRVKKENMESIVNVARNKIDPPIKPAIEVMQSKKGDVCVIEIPKMFTGVPHAVKGKDGKVYFIRVWSTTREPSNEELRDLFQIAIPVIKTQ
jgi:ATP-dependent DNA helicase RecG